MDKQFSEGYSELDKIDLFIKINREIHSNKLKVFVQSKIDVIFDGLVNKNRFFTYEDMYQVIPLIRNIMKNNYIIKYEPIEIINGYYNNIKFSYQYKLMDEFSEIYPDIYKDFVNQNRKDIKRDIIELIINDAEFYEEQYNDDLWTFIDLELPDILNTYNMKLPDWVKEELEEISGYIIFNEREKIKFEVSNESVKGNIRKANNIRSQKDRTEEEIGKELEKLLGKEKDILVEDEKKIIFEKIQNKELAKQIYHNVCEFNKIKMPISILSLRFFKRVLMFMNKKNKAYTNFNEFMEEFIDYSLGKSLEKEKIIEKLSQFCYEMCIKNINIWREETLKEHPIFAEDTEIIDFLIKCKILDRNSQWIEFYNDTILWYFCILQTININENASQFMYKLRDRESINDNECLIMLIYSSINAEKINKEFIEKELKQYIEQVQCDDKKDTCRKIIEQCEYELELDKKLKDESETYIVPLVFDILQYASLYFAENIPALIYGIKKDKEDFKLLKSKCYQNEEYSISFLKCINDEQMYKLFEKYGIWDEFYNTYKYIKEILNSMQKGNYKTDIRN